MTSKTPTQPSLPVVNGRRQRARPRSLPIDVAAVTHPGRVRDNNEDSVLLEPPVSQAARARGTLCIVADGMGGYAAGEVASQLAVQTVRERYYSSDSTFVEEALRQAVEQANTEVWQQAQRQSDQAGMGSTVTAAVVRDDSLVVCQVGDSRAYLVRSRERQMKQVTRDHSWVEEQVAAGTLTREQARTHPERNVITRALGHRASVQVDVYRETLEDGDLAVLCSDGLTGVVTDDEIGRRVLELPPQRAAEALIELANERGAPDNVSVAVIKVGQTPQPAPLDVVRRWWPLAVVAASLAIVAVVLAATSASPTSPPPPASTAAATAPAQATPAIPTSLPTAAPISGLPVQPVPTPAASPAVSVNATGAVIGTGRVKDIEGGNLRSGPIRTSAPTRITYDARFDVLAVQPGEEVDGNNRWYYVRVTSAGPAGAQPGDMGFVHDSFVTVTLSAQSPTPRP